MTVTFNLLDKPAFTGDNSKAPGQNSLANAVSLILDGFLGKNFQVPVVLGTNITVSDFSTFGLIKISLIIQEKKYFHLRICHQHIIFKFRYMNFRF